MERSRVLCGSAVGGIADSRPGRFFAVVLAIIVVGWSAGVVLADTKTGSVGGISTSSHTDGLSFDSLGTGASGSSQAFGTMDDIEAHARPFNNEFGWHMSGSQENAVSSPGDFVITPKAYAGGNNSGDYTCTHLGVTCYVTTQS